MFETQYNALWLAADEVAERIRTLDVFAPGSYSQFGKLTSIKEEVGVPEWKEMVNQLVEGHEIAAHTARGTIKAADVAGDEGTADMVTGRLKEHEKPPGCFARCSGKHGDKRLAALESDGRTPYGAAFHVSCPSRGGSTQAILEVESSTTADLALTAAHAPC
jgi:hypothetical protein